MVEPAIRHRHETIEGTILHVAEAGDPSAATCLVCLHGWPESWAAFEAVMVLLQGDVHVIAIDLPGIGSAHLALRLPCRARTARNAGSRVRGRVLRLVPARPVGAA